ncbi:MAG: hypothetical protein ACODAU_13145 [Myxococcota bacterium]
MHRAVAWAMVFAVGCRCGVGGCGADEEGREAESPSEPAPVAASEPERDEAGERFQVFGYALAPYGAARGVWESHEIDGTEVVLRAERGEDGDGRVTGERDGEEVVALHVRDGVLYEVRGDRCRASTGDMEAAMRRLPGLVPLDGVAATVYGLLGDGIPESVAEPVEDEAPGGLAEKGYRFRTEADSSLYDVTVTGEAWMDAEDRPVRSGGKLQLDPRFGGEEPGSASWSYAVEPTEVEAVEVPAECTTEPESGLSVGDLPRLEGHEDIVVTGGNLAYRAPATVAEALALYEDELIEEGWQVESSGQREETGTYRFARDDELLTVIATKKGDGVTVVISHVD